MPRKVRDYADEYKKYQGTPEQKKNRAARNKVRRQAVASGRVQKGSGKDIDHKVPLSKGGSTSVKNTRVVSEHTNRSYARTKKGGVK